jgi:hypothetical protein
MHLARKIFLVSSFFCAGGVKIKISIIFNYNQFRRQKDKNEKKRQFTVIIEEGEDGYLIGTALELKGCHTQGKTMEELLKNVKERVKTDCEYY